MIQLEEFSVYNTLNQSKSPSHPLGFLAPEDTETGWHVARNLKKPLNHLDFLRRKEQIATQLNLHNICTDAQVFEHNYNLLEQHQRGLLSTDNVIEQIVSQLCLDGKTITIAEATHLLYEYSTVRHMEFHPSDVCNLTCQGCTYGHDNPETKPLPINFPFENIGKIAKLKPKSMNIIGGGEPTLYKSQSRSFQDVVDEIVDTNPGITLSLVTNGTHRPLGDWPNQMLWIRLSLDAATEATYQAFRGKPTFNRVVKNFLDYLDFNARYVGISFLYAKPNIHEYAQVANFIFQLVKEQKPNKLPKVNIQYRPLRRDPRDYHKSFDLAIDEDDIKKTTQDVIKLAQSSPEMAKFLKEQTNITAVLGGNSHPAHKFDRCYYSQTFKIVRANGDLRPCFIRVKEPDFVLGNIQHDSLAKISLNTIYVGARRKVDCDPHGCRQCHVNYVFEQGLQGRMQPSDSPEVLADPMY